MCSESNAESATKEEVGETFWVEDSEMQSKGDRISTDHWLLFHLSI